LSTIRNADTILVMKKGKIVETGNHDSLLRDHPNGIYAKLVKQQEEAEENQNEEEVEVDPQEINMTPKSGTSYDDGNCSEGVSANHPSFAGSPLKGYSINKGLPKPMPAV
jgi:ABC-type glutathione transport system ATPase component